MVNLKCVPIIAISIQGSSGFCTFCTLAFEKEHYISGTGSVHVLRLSDGGGVLGTIRHEEPLPIIGQPYEMIQKGRNI